MAHGATIQFYRGAESGLPTLAAGEPAFTTDSFKFFIGDGSTNHEIGGSVSDGDKGDVTVSSSGATWTIDNGAVTYAKIQDVSAASKLLGRGDSGSGDVEEITIGSGLSMSGTTLSASGGGSPGGLDTYVQFNDGGAFGGDSRFTYIKATGVFLLTGSGGYQFQFQPGGSAGYFTDGTRQVYLCDGSGRGGYFSTSPYAVYIASTTESAAIKTDDGTRQVKLSDGSQAGYFTDGTRTVALADGTNHISYAASNSGNWASGSPPTDVWVALDRIAAALAGLSAAP